MLTRPMLFFNTVRYLKFRQIINRVKRNFLKPRVLPTGPPDIALLQERLEPVIKCQQKISHNGTLKFLNKEFNLSMIDDWNPSSQEKLWIYNLHYFDDLNSVNSEKRFSLHGCLIQKWIDENPIGFGSGWEPYPSSLRIVNWIKWFLLNESVEKNWLHSLANQARYLSQNIEYHLFGNHLIANSKALIFAGLYFHGNEADEWYEAGIEIFSQELSEQILKDGGHFELSPMYHSIILEDLMDLINLHKAYNKDQPKNIIAKAAIMIQWLEIMCHPDGDISFFNDAAFSIAPSLNQLLIYAKQLDIDYVSNNKSLIHLADSGYIKCESKNAVLLADVARVGPDYIPGHGHADTLSFELSLFGDRFIVNSGISTYKVGVERLKQRGTLSHSSITFDDKNSSEVWGGFRVAKRAKVYNITKDNDHKNNSFSACHDGYKRLNGVAVHCRKWSMSENLLEIIDKISGDGYHKVTSVLPLHPNVLVSDIKSNSVSLNLENNKIRVDFEGNGTLDVVDSKYHPEFGISIDNKQIIYNYNGILPFKLIMKISW